MSKKTAENGTSPPAGHPPDPVAKAKAELHARFAEASEMTKNHPPHVRALVELSIKAAEAVIDIGERDPLMRKVALSSFAQQEARDVAAAVEEAAKKVLAFEANVKALVQQGASPEEAVAAASQAAGIQPQGAPQPPVA